MGYENPPILKLHSLYSTFFQLISMALLGQTGADTLTHIVSIVALLSLGLGVGITAIEVSYGHGVPLTDLQWVALATFETVVALGMAYYSVKYQQTPTGGVVVSTDATSVK